MCSSLARFMMQCDGRSFARIRRRKASLACARTDVGEHGMVHVDASGTFCVTQAVPLTRSTSSMEAAGAWN